MDQNVLFYRLEREAKYALNSHIRALVYQTFGAAKMAFELEAITKAQFYRSNDMLVVHGLNDPGRCRLD